MPWNVRAGTIIKSFIYLYENFSRVHMLDIPQETSEEVYVYVPDLEP